MNMQVVRDFPHPVTEIEHLEIPMADGCRLAARIWMPADASSRPVPAILEYIPYRKNDFYAWRDSIAHPFVAGHGYACVRVDCRGSGESEGVLRDEYLQQELDDGKDVIAWIAAQPWCSGQVGMTGISWGGFNGLQIAALQPPALKAVITIASTDDRYADDVHYMGGCLLAENLSWASIMFGRNTLPPDPRLVGERWRAMWQDRLEHSGLWLQPWLEHQTRDAYWRHGSVCEDFTQIKCAVYAIGGWADGYVNAVFRLLEGLKVPRKGLIGPWAHHYPHMGNPGPAIGYLQESIRWWDYWLKGVDTGIMLEPMLRAWMQEPVEPRTAYVQREGRWIAESGWPSTSVSSNVWQLQINGGLRADSRGAESSAALSFASPLSVGLLGGKWCSYAVPGDQPGDQRADDAGGLVFETAPLERPFEILGQCVLELGLESDRPVAMIAARLNSVAPDGAATRVTFGILNLTHRNSHEHPEPLVPGQRYTVRVPFKHVGQAFPAGHRLRLALSTSYWPMLWAPPELATLTVHTGSSQLTLPVRAANPMDQALRSFAEPACAPALVKEDVEAPQISWRVVHDLSNAGHTLEIRSGIGTIRFPSIDWTLATTGFEQYSLRDGDPNSQRGEASWQVAVSRGAWRVNSVTSTTLTCDTRCFYVTAHLKAYENGNLVFERTWQQAILRQLV